MLNLIFTVCVTCVLIIVISHLNHGGYIREKGYTAGLLNLIKWRAQDSTKITPSSRAGVWIANKLSCTVSSRCTVRTFHSNQTRSVPQSNQKIWNLIKNKIWKVYQHTEQAEWWTNLSHSGNENSFVLSIERWTITTGIQALDWYLTITNLTTSIHMLFQNLGKSCPSAY